MYPPPLGAHIAGSIFYRDDLIQFGDLEFARTSIQVLSNRGSSFIRQVPIGMPRIPPKMLDCVCYLYNSEEDAKKGKDFGGTAFLVAVPSPDPSQVFIYAVSNWHVACQGASVLRVNTHDGGSDIIPYGPEDWSFDPRYDIAVRHFDYRREIHRCSLLALEGLALQEHIENQKIGPGDDVFMVGRFVDHDGGPINRPAVRFGNVSVMPSPIMQPNGQMADAYCIDLHSRSGYSGSPVFAYRTPGFDLEEPSPKSLETSKILFAGTNYLACLGIHFSQFPEAWEFISGSAPAKEMSNVPLVASGGYIKGLSGMTCVLPAWYIVEVLNMPSVKGPRDASIAVMQEKQRRAGQGMPSAESAIPIAPEDANPRHKEDFTSLLNAAAKTKTPAGRT